MKNMTETEILAFITQVESEELDPMYVAKAYAATVNEMQDRLDPEDLQRLLLLGAAMYRNSLKGMHVELQLPATGNEADERLDLDRAPFTGILH